MRSRYCHLSWPVDQRQRHVARKVNYDDGLSIVLKYAAVDLAAEERGDAADAGLLVDDEREPDQRPARLGKARERQV